ncbi:MAG: alpha-mannosidase [Rhizonema sp. NSF051]|nr:alpha-mannosidase [Rhizonema sp. NSF051]
MLEPPLNTEIILAAIDKLRSCCQVNIQEYWRFLEIDLTVAELSEHNVLDWETAQLNHKGYLTWAGGQKVLWLVQKVVVPQNLQGYALQGLSLRLPLHWWADSAQIYVNGKLVVEGDLFDCSPRVLLSCGVTPGEEFLVALRLVSPSHCDGALVKSQLLYESTDGDRPDAGFVADELAVMQRYLEFEPENLDVLLQATEEIMNIGAEQAEELEKTFLTVREKLLKTKIQPPKSKIYLLGHAHLDLAWLWPVSETWNAAQSTFESVLQLQQDFPLIFCHSTPALYAWIEENRPDLFTAIQQAVAAGCWEVLGGFWVEPELNLIAGESIVRQLLYGQRYLQQKFGKLSPVVWVPDSFGFCATLPQFFASAGIEYFVTQKLIWNDTTKFEHNVFWWRSPDGSEVFSLMSARIGESVDPIAMAYYSCEWQTQTGLDAALWLPGVGDHGGGPTRDMLEIAQRWNKSPFFPHLEFTTAEKYLRDIQSELSTPHPSASNFPTWEDELYLEFHRGCYTTHGDQKRWNRRCEGLLYQAELFAALANISCGVTYPTNEIEAAWKKVLFNQFHDILPGTSINQVYVDALPTWQEVEKVGNEILQKSLRAISSNLSLPEPPQPDSLPVVVFNSLNWQRSEVVSVALPTPSIYQRWEIYDVSGKKQPSQLGEASTLLFLASDIPSVGYRVFWLCPNLEEQKEQLLPNKFTLENEFLQVVVDEQTGDLSSVFDKVNNKEVLSLEGGNKLQVFGDSGQYWDAWNIDPNYAQHSLASPQLKSIEWLESGTVQSRLRVVRQLGDSEFCQDYILQMRSPILKIATTVNWQERQVLVKAAFPLSVEADYATYEIPCGTIRRSTKPETPAEKAKWEVPALRWADITENHYGVSLLNDCKYGYDSQNNQLRLTLLRSPNWPDPEADRGFHQFTYALYPHAGSWQSAHTVRRGYELNLPLLVDQDFAPRQLTSLEENSQSLPSVSSLLNLSAENLILMAFKQAEDDKEQWILRCYESHGEIAELSLQSDLGLTLGESVDLLERSVETRPSFTILPWKIASFKVLHFFPVG